MTDTQLEALALATMRKMGWSCPEANQFGETAILLAALKSVQQANSGSPAIPTRSDEIATNRESDAIEQIMIGGNHLASALIGWLGASEPGFPAYSASLADARKAIADIDKYDAWVCWKFIMMARDQLRPALPIWDTPTEGEATKGSPVSQGTQKIP